MLPAPLGDLWRWAALLAAGLSFTVLLRARPRDVGWVVLAGVLAIEGVRLGGRLLGPQLGAFIGALLVGIGGNLYDRLGLWDSTGLKPHLHHGVRDWILFVWPEIKLQIFNPWPNFNIADSLLVTGAIMLVVHSLLWREPKAERPAA